MDDANVPSLLSLPYLGFVDAADQTYVNTRATLFSKQNKWFFNGTVGSGIGGPHVGSGYAWVSAVSVRVFESSKLILSISLRHAAHVAHHADPDDH